MARAKKRKAPRQLWAAKDPGSKTVLLFNKKPTLRPGKCDSCTQCTPGVFQGGYLYDFCEPDFQKMTGIKIAEGETFQIKVTRVEE